MRPQGGDRTVETHRPADRAGERQAGEARPQAVERQRIGGHVGVHAKRVAAHVEPHRAAHGARRRLAVAVAQRAAELGVPVGSRERPGRVEQTVERHRRRELLHGAQVHGRRFHAKAAERQAAGEQIHVSPAADARLGPAGDERIAEQPVHLEREPAEPAVRPRVPGEPAVEGQAVEERVGQPEIQIGGLHVGLAHGDEAGVRGAHRGELARQPAAAVGEIERVDVDLEQAPAVRADVDVAVQHGARREAAAHEREVGERRGVGFGREVVEHGVARPAQLPLEAEPRAGESHAPQVGFEGIAGDPDAALQLGDAQ